MDSMRKISEQDIERTYEQLKNGAEAGGYHLNPDTEFTKDLIHGLIVNEQRYGYQACPCRLAEGNKEKDLDIICPCDYRDPDLAQYDTCYCGLYVSQRVVDGEKEIGKIPERRPLEQSRQKMHEEKASSSISPLSYPVWRCKVCGYLCGRDEPPAVCPVCKAKKERFERFI